ncbi:MAG: tetratricopeptide repeat protein [Anaerolineae bacterium]|nr:tetratricopeptide repeat protein [Anaerolineae bacterium]
MNTLDFSDKAEALLAAHKLDELEATINDALRDQAPKPVVPSDPARMWLEYYQSRLHWARQRWRAAESSFRKLLDQDLPVDLRARVLRWLGESLHYGGQWQEQSSLEQEALVLSSVLDDESTRPAIYNLMGWNHLRRSRYQEALGAFEHALHLCQGTGQKEQEAWALNNLGVTYMRMGDMAKALDAHQASLAIRREAGLQLHEGRSLYQIAAVLVTQGHWRQAEKYLSDSEIVARKTGDQIGLSYVMFMRGQWEKGQGRLEKALDAYQQSLALRSTVGSPSLIAEAHWALCDTYRMMGNWPKAADHAEQAADAWRDVTRPWANSAASEANPGKAQSNLPG